MRMAEFLVLKVSRSGLADADADAKRYKLGDVITIQDDGYAWSALDTEAGHAKLVKAPGIPKEDFIQLLSESAPNPNEHRRVRLWMFKDIVNIPATVNLPNATAFIATHCEQHPALPVSGLFDINLRAVR
jgi:hypothetical protein